MIRNGHWIMYKCGNKAANPGQMYKLPCSAGFIELCGAVDGWYKAPYNRKFELYCPTSENSKIIPKEIRPITPEECAGLDIPLKVKISIKRGTYYD